MGLRSLKLIALLVLFGLSFQVFASQASYVSRSEGAGGAYSCSAYPERCKTGSYGTPVGTTYYWIQRCNSGEYIGTVIGQRDVGSADYPILVPIYSCENEPPPPECEEIWTAEGMPGECMTCPVGTVDAGEEIMPRCQLIEEPPSCLEKGEFYESDGYCIPVCKSGSSLDHFCNDPPDDQCSSSSSDYIGSIGYGGSSHPVCGDNSCPSGGTFGYEVDSAGAYNATCFPPGSNPPQCPGGSALIVGEGGYSFQCEGINKPDGTEQEESNGDSDGDGEGDTTGITGQLEDIKRLLKGGNNERSNLKNKLDTINKSINDGVGVLKDAIGNIPGGGGSTPGDGEGEAEEPVTWTGESIVMEVDDGLEELEAVKAEYETLITNIRAEMAGSFGSITGSGSLPSNTITIEGVQIESGLAKWADHLSIVGMVILFAAAFVSLGVVMGSKD